MAIIALGILLLNSLTRELNHDQPSFIGIPIFEVQNYSTFLKRLNLRTCTAYAGRMQSFVAATAIERQEPDQARAGKLIRGEDL